MGLHAEQQVAPPISWQERYGGRHGFVRLAGDPGLPNGRRGRVTIYQRGVDAMPAEGQTFILSWSSAGKRKKERVVGDGFDAVRRADEINSAVRNGTPSKSAGISVDALVLDYLELLERRAQAGEVAPNTPRRYRSALVHLTDFMQQEGKPRSGRIWTPTRDFILRFRAHLQGKMVSSNGHSNTPPPPSIRKRHRLCCRERSCPGPLGYTGRPALASCCRGLRFCLQSPFGGPILVCFADHRRRADSVDPDGRPVPARLVLLSHLSRGPRCGAVLGHDRVR